MKWLVLNKSTQIPEITISGYIGSYDKVNYEQFNEALNQLKEAGATKVKVYINSGGGDMLEGLALYDAAAESGLEFEVQVIGMAASMGSLLMYIGNEKPVISKNARVMFHKPQAGAYGESSSLRNRADLCDSLEATIKTLLVAKTGKTAAEIDAWFVTNNETWMTADEAVTNGVCSSIVASGTEATELPEPNETLNEEQLYNMVYNKISNKNNFEMKYSNDAKIQFGLPTSSTDADVDAHIANLNAKAAKADTLEAQMVANNKSRAKALIDQAINDKKLTEADRETYEAKAESDYDFVSNMLGKMKSPTLPIDGITPGTPGADTTDRSKWSLTDWAKNDYDGLEKMKLENREKYATLCKAAGVPIS